MPGKNHPATLNVPLTVGIYTATPAFRGIVAHHCVCADANGALITVTGPADDTESQEWAAHIVKCCNSHAALMEALTEQLGPANDLTDAQCHVGICPVDQCGRCSRELKARKALAAALGT